MGIIGDFTPEKLICGVLTSRIELLDDVKHELCGRFGVLDYESGPFPFDFTDYYDREMGSPIMRFFLSFKELIAPDSLAEIKIFTNKVEERHSEEKQRRANLDPGLISLKRLILASTKDNGRRIPLSKGIYAEITLVFIDGAFQPVPWTYPDYCSQTYRDIMKEIREIYKSQLKR